MDGVLDEIKIKMADRVTLKDIYRNLSVSSRKELVDIGAFKRVFRNDIKLGISQIDLDFMINYYRDKRDKKSVKYTVFMDDLKAKFGSEEKFKSDKGISLKVPADKNFTPGKSFSRKDFETPKKDEDIQVILKELRRDARGKEIKLDEEFAKFSKTGLVTSKEFKEVFDRYGLKTSRRDITKLVDRYINTIDDKIDTSVMIDHMFHNHDLYNPLSSRKKSPRGRKSRDGRSKDRKLAEPKSLRRKDDGRKRSSKHGESSRRRTKDRHGDKSRDHKQSSKDHRNGKYNKKVGHTQYRSDHRGKSKGNHPKFEEDKNHQIGTIRESSRPRKDKGKIARYIGRKLKDKDYDYVDHLKQIAGDDIDFILTDKQIFKMCDAAGIKLTKPDQKFFVLDMDRPNFTVEEFLIKCKLNADQFQTVGLADEVILTTEEEDQAKSNLEKIGTAIQDEKKEFEKVFNIGPYDKKLDFSEFKFGLLNELNSDCSNMANHDKTLMLLKNFLVEDANKDDKIDVKNLYLHLFPLGEGKQEIKTKMN